MPKTANAFHTNLTLMAKSSSIVTLEIHIWENWPNLHKALSKLLTYNNYQSTVPFLYSDCQLLLSASTFADCCHFLNITIEDVNVVPQSLCPTHTRYNTSNKYQNEHYQIQNCNQERLIL
jgi:hypothetical protein